MLGSVHDAEDALQETFVRAWRGIAGLRDRSTARAWLYSIATNVCLTELSRRGRRALPQDFGPAAEPHTPPGAPLAETTWIEPYPDEVLGAPSGRATPEASYEQREALELAFVAALQHLTPNQRAALILREVLGFSAREAASMLATTTASVNSAVQRARAAVAARAPDRSQQQTLRALGDRALAQLVDRYVAAWERCDVDAFAELLTDDVSFAMPPLTTWYTPRDTVLAWARASSMSGQWQWRAVPVRANGQLALAFYSKDGGGYLPFAINVLTLRGDRVADVTAFIVRATDTDDPDAYRRFPEQAMHPRLGDLFARFELPDRLSTD